MAFKRIQDSVPLHIRSILLGRLADRQPLVSAVIQYLTGGAAELSEGGSVSMAAVVRSTGARQDKGQTIKLTSALRVRVCTTSFASSSYLHVPPDLPTV